MKYKDFKMLSKNEMKKITGGSGESGSGCTGQGYSHARVVCVDTAIFDSVNWCANSVGVCNGHQGFSSCYCFN